MCGNKFTEELYEYLVRKGYSEDYANDIHDAYYDFLGIDGAIKESSKWNDEVERDVKAWQKEVGE